MIAQQKSFSQTLESWLKSKKPKTLGDLQHVFGAKSFGIAFLLLLFIPALPLPTGGVSHVTEVIAMLLALEMIIGRRELWLPKKWSQRPLGHATEARALPFIMRRVRWFEKWSRPRLSSIFTDARVRTFMGLVIFAFCLAAFLSPPFSGLDTLPALGVVIMALSLILEDVALLIIGIVVGSGGVGIIIGLGKALVTLIPKLWN